MVRAYAENGFTAEALSLFRELQTQGMKPDAMTIMSLLPVSSQMASVHLLRQCHGYVVRACLSDLFLKGALLDMYAKCGAIVCAYKLFQSSPDKESGYVYSYGWRVSHAWKGRGSTEGLLSHA